MALLEYLPNIITFIFFLVVCSYYFFLFVRIKKPAIEKKFNSIAIIIPAHNEEKYIARCIRSAIRAEFEGSKEILVIDDGSKDRTAEIASEFISDGVKVIKQSHSGKAASINKAIESSKGELIAVIDGDSEIPKDALVKVVKEVERKKVAAASCIVRVKNRHRFICIWLEIEQLYNSLIRKILTKLNANIVTPGPLSIYRREELQKVGGFSTDGFSEDIDVTIRLIRAGYKIGFSDKVVADTNMPYDTKGFLRQRTRLARGVVNIFKKHLKVNKALIDIYTLPLFFFTYLQSVIMGGFTIYNVVSGYITYFLSKDIIFNMYTLKFFFDWFSVVGFFKWAFGLLIGTTPLTLVNVAGVLATLLTYPLFVYAIYKYSKFDWLHIIGLVFMPLFWLLIMMIYIISLPEYFRKKQHNIWKKNE